MENPGIIPCLWFDSNAQEAVNYYCEIFKDSQIMYVNHFPAGAPRPEGMVMTIGFKLNGQEFMALNGGPEFKFNEAISMMVKCKTQDEIDFFWEKLSEGGKEVECGWLKDKFGLSWQVVPDGMEKLTNDNDLVRSMRVTQAILKMKKLDIAALERAFEGGIE